MVDTSERECDCLRALHDLIIVRVHGDGLLKAIRQNGYRATCDNLRDGVIVIIGGSATRVSDGDVHIDANLLREPHGECPLHLAFLVGMLRCLDTDHGEVIVLTGHLHCLIVDDIIRILGQGIIDRHRDRRAVPVAHDIVVNASHRDRPHRPAVRFPVNPVLMREREGRLVALQDGIRVHRDLIRRAACHVQHDNATVRHRTRPELDGE